jgi:hypothetical protein
VSLNAESPPPSILPGSKTLLLMQAAPKSYISFQVPSTLEIALRLNLGVKAKLEIFILMFLVLGEIMLSMTSNSALAAIGQE